MVGRPPKDDTRDKQYRVRLNDEENVRLSFCSEETGEAKSDIFRKALNAYYENAKLVKSLLKDKEDVQAEKDMGYDEDIEYDEYEENEFTTDHISLKRAIICPYCGASNNIDFAENHETSSEERQMGPETEYSFDWQDWKCVKCKKPFRIHGSIWEYPMGAYNSQSINVEPLEDDEDEE